MQHPENWMNSDEMLHRIHQTRIRILESGSSLPLLKSLRKELTTEKAAFVLTQAELQIKAKSKFSNSDQMLFTQKALEQASSDAIAKYKSNRIPVGQVVLDACCGIGGDAIGLGQNHQLVCVDSDPLLAFYCRHNLEVHNVEGCQVQTALFKQVEISDNNAIHIDPDRRANGKRATRQELFSPTIENVLSKCNDEQLVCIKVAPATDDIPSQHLCCREWVGIQRECKQQLLWFNSEQQVEKMATVVDRDGGSTSLVAKDENAVFTSQVGDFLFEPHSAVLAADMIDDLAVQFDFQRLHPANVYLTSNRNCNSSLFQSFQLLGKCRLRKKEIQELFQEFDIGKVEWKSRGLDKKTFDKFQKIRPAGGQAGVAILTRLGDEYVCYVCRRS